VTSLLLPGRRAAVLAPSGTLYVNWPAVGDQGQARHLAALTGARAYYHDPELVVAAWDPVRRLLGAWEGFARGESDG
jgi:hypothetical protein